VFYHVKRGAPGRIRICGLSAPEVHALSRGNGFEAGERSAAIGDDESLDDSSCAATTLDGAAWRLRLDNGFAISYPVKVTTLPPNNCPPGCGGRGPQDRSALAQQFTELDHTSEPPASN
jgi:hypothetical protein